jgi:signal transduction histidine kinase
VAGIAVLVIAAVSVLFHDPFEFDDRPHIERLMRLVLSNVQGDTAVDMEERMSEQVKFGESGDLLRVSAREWNSMSGLFLAHNGGYLGLQLFNKNCRKVRTAALPQYAGLAETDFLADSRLENLLHSAASSNSRVATASVTLPNGRLGYLIAVPNFANGEIVGFLVVIADIEKTLNNMLSEFKGLGYSVAVRDRSRELYESGGPEYRAAWTQSAEVPLPMLEWRVEVWPKPEIVAGARSPLPEFGALVGLLLLLLLSSSIVLAHQLQAKSVLLTRAHDELELRVRERTAQLQHVNKALLHAQDGERRRIARELHDSTVQTMGAIAIDLEKAQRLLPDEGNPKVQNLLADSSQLVERATTELRTMSYLLHPPMLDDLGLKDVLPWYAAGFSERSGIHVSVDIQSDLGRLPDEVELAVFRIVQEGLTNIHRHSGSSTAEISLFHDGQQLTLRIVDHGRGIPAGGLVPSDGARTVIGVGIAGMRERLRQLGGQLQIESGDHGTLLAATLPILGTTPVSTQKETIGGGSDGGLK